MAVVPLTSPYVMQEATLEIDVDDFTEAVSEVTFTPSATVSTWRGIGGNVRRASATAEWTLTLGHAQDLAPTGLTRYLLDHEGETKTVTLTPLTAGPSITADVIISPATIGGSAGSELTPGTVTLAVDGKPVFVDPV